jgi:predicted RNA binding protein YcfA (HicA-like mRNA interferase family)
MVNQERSHRQFKHHQKKGKVTVAGKPSLDIHPKTLKTIIKQAQWDK